MRISFPPLRKILRHGFIALTLIALLPGFGCASAPALSKSASLKRDQETNSSLLASELSQARKQLAAARNSPAASPAQTEALTAYNVAVTRVVLALQNRIKDGDSWATASSFRETEGAFKLHIASGINLLNPDHFQRLISASSISRKHLLTNVRRSGLGAEFVGVIQPDPRHRQNCPPQGWVEPLTVIADFSPSAKSGETLVTLSFLDPRTREHVSVQKTQFPLAADFTAPLASYPHPNKILLGFAAMLRSDMSLRRSGIYFYEPYSPNKIPVLFVHGLMSSPHAWISFINELNANPEFRRRYQAWVYFYPSGLPIAANALRLRRALADLEARHIPKKKMILVGHSMGGILAKMQVTNTRTELWKGIFGSRASAFIAKLPPDSLIRQALFFEANPHVSRVIFIATPHLGSRLATLHISTVFGSIIRMPAAAVGTFNSQVKSALQSIEPSLRSIPSSIVGLSPKSPLLKNLRHLPLTVPYHSIIGNRGRTNEALENSSDGIVPYWSSHLPGAESELIVPTGHDAFENPKSVEEVLRILAL